MRIKGEKMKKLIEKKQIFKTDTKSLIGAIVMGIVFVLACQISGQIDNFFPWGKIGMYLINGSCWAFFTGLITLLYKQPGGLIAAEVEAMISVMYSPLWIAFIFANAVGSIWVSIIDSKFAMTKWSHFILAQGGVCILGNTIVGFGLVFFLGIPVNIAIIQTIGLILVNWLVSTIAIKKAYEAILKSGLIR